MIEEETAGFNVGKEDRKEFLITDMLETIGDSVVSSVAVIVATRIPLRKVLAIGETAERRLLPGVVLESSPLVNEVTKTSNVTE